ncbi:hypothetical protein [Ancylomarina sp. 16SWW S1-10-2]|uniref:hypothetical protein n=1 Tax=Ancylomarina sp. 16SWW S1-10-2 TaxID=2499681 RepID=UPI0012AE3FED|nr:hypothetical protein [Ancylomarina sp. 16SWW S1-10-2]MRT92809.1 hypothetical protein [Ancylomarina sp. 16SWW S1-10-2]
MKYTTVHLDENKIELFNTLLGKETVKVNGKIVSEKSSITGTEHNFVINENGNEIACKLTTGLSMNGVVFSLYKKNKPVIEMAKSGKLAFVFFVLIGIIVGYSILNK